jgi:hypothetical protein
MDRPTTKIDLEFAKPSCSTAKGKRRDRTDEGTQSSVKLAFCKIVTKDVGIYKENVT